MRSRTSATAAASGRAPSEACKGEENALAYEGLPFFYEMAPSPAARKVTLKTNASCRIVMCAPGTNEYLVFESQFEADCARVFWAMPNVRSVQAQYGPVKYTDECGVTREHYADLRVEFMNGWVALYCVRPIEKDRRGKLRAAVEDIRNHELRYHADRIEILTEKAVTKADIYRAREILAARRLKNSPDCVRLLEKLRAKDKPVRAFELLDEFGSQGSGMIALWNLMGDKLVDHVASDASLTFTPVSFVRARRPN
ncbi:hypothetical protein RRU01S_39_00120 [Agrobacterium rubi TR3 = NBRC 13261]|uniref:TnsA endonuclease N-terminal domain-containing protein n=1 Tax=Agrobacterium rubi TR3 = NBRC 13261 TaxID=1368415 RepID=A0A081D3D6_9HYPH|nr:hypothetical protein RRU01S_39_00120 [Agrobacterium rubi TR3 = NBRC 13261]